MASDFVDLTASPDDPPHRKRRRSPEAVDLVSGDEDGAETRGAAADEAEEARRRIMAHARRVNRERGISAPAASPAGPAAGLHSAALHNGRQEEQNAAAAAQGEQHLQSPAPVTNSLLAQLHAERLARQAARQQAGGAAAGQAQQNQQQGQQHRQQEQQAEPSRQNGAWQPHQQHRHAQHAHQREHPKLSLLTWNVWFREDIHVEHRMAAIGEVIRRAQPTFVCLQEVTPLIYSLFSASAWWGAYHASPCPPGAAYFTVLLWSRAGLQGAGQLGQIPFENSCMGRDLKTIAGKVAGRSVRVATSHLESPMGWDRPFSEARQAQLKQAAEVLDQAREDDVLFAGDMNWLPTDGLPPLPGGWSDAWLHLHGGAGEQEGLTYDARANPMLKKSNKYRRRLDRVFCKLRRWRPSRLELVGTEALPDLQFEGRPVLPSDHFGILLELRPAG